MLTAVCVLVLCCALNTGSAWAKSGGVDNPGGISGVYGNAISGNISGKNVHIEAGDNISNGVYGGLSLSSGNASGNTVTITGGNVSNAVYGGAAEQGTASGNKVTISGGTVLQILGGQSSNGPVTGNTVTISGGNLNGDIYGGQSSGRGPATGNTVIIRGGIFDQRITLHGGSCYWGTEDGRTGNTLEVHTAGLQVGWITNFQHFRFYLPSTVTAGDTMLTVTDAAGVDIRTPTTGPSLGATTVGVGIMGGGTPLAKNDTVTLIHATGAGKLKADADMPNTFEGMSGISKAYKFELEFDDEDPTSGNATKMMARVTDIQSSDASIRKSPAEAKAASVAIVTQGADLAAGQGMGNAREAAKSSAASGAGLGVAGFGAVSGGTSTYKTGSHVDVNSVSFMVGLAKRLPVQSADFLVGAFFETGFGSYDSYNGSATGQIHGWGNSNYYGGGLLGRVDLTEGVLKGLYAEATARVGGLTSDYKSDDLNPALGRGDYDTTATYYGAHVGLGYIWNLTEKAELDIYGKYFWTHTAGTDVTILGDEVNFKAVDSHRTRLGARFGYQLNDYVKPFIGAAWEHEFDGKARSVVAGIDTPAPSLKGDTGMGELGITWKPVPESGFAVNLGVQGFVGQREGMSGFMQLKYEF